MLGPLLWVDRATGALDTLKQKSLPVQRDQDVLWDRRLLNARFSSQVFFLLGSTRAPVVFAGEFKWSVSLVKPAPIHDTRVAANFYQCKSANVNDTL